MVFPTSLSLPRFSNGADESNMLPGKLKDALQTVTCSFFGAIEAVCCGLVKVELVGATGFFYKKNTTHRMLYMIIYGILKANERKIEYILNLLLSTCPDILTH